ncbi:MAG: ATP-binding protein [Gammaproteobacteria bacterium]
MKRILLDYLTNWLHGIDRKPLVLRGARQVGKTWLVRHLAKSQNKKLIELNFEKQPSHVSLFKSNDPNTILLNLSTLFNDIDPKNSLLFLDEIQTSPELLSKLRWFAEELPELPVIAAGSLLEFVLTEHSFSMPVGRISYAHLEPLSFEEFLLATKNDGFLTYLENFTFNTDIPPALHEQLTRLFQEYALVGGMPAATQSWITEKSPNKISQIQNDLLATYRDDFAKYRGRIATERLEEVMLSIPRRLGEKFVYSRINKDIPANTIKKVLDILQKAKLCHRVQSCAANGIPLAAEINEKHFKEIFLDVGLCSAALGLNLHQLLSLNDITLINNGGIAEQVAGQLLRTVNPPYIEPALYYWQREEAKANAEIDYIIQHNNQVIPVEVKAGRTGSLKSLHYFMELKKYPLAVRINADPPSKTPVNTKTIRGEPLSYTLVSIPFYLISQIHRLIQL